MLVCCKTFVCVCFLYTNMFFYTPFVHKAYKSCFVTDFCNVFLLVALLFVCYVSVFCTRTCFFTYLLYKKHTKVALRTTFVCGVTR